MQEQKNAFQPLILSEQNDEVITAKNQLSLRRGQIFPAIKNAILADCPFAMHPFLQGAPYSNVSALPQCCGRDTKARRSCQYKRIVFSILYSEVALHFLLA